MWFVVCQCCDLAKSEKGEKGEKGEQEKKGEKGKEGKEDARQERTVLATTIDPVRLVECKAFPRYGKTAMLCLHSKQWLCPSKFRWPCDFLLECERPMVNRQTLVLLLAFLHDSPVKPSWPGASDAFCNQALEILRSVLRASQALQSQFGMYACEVVRAQPLPRKDSYLSASATCLSQEGQNDQIVACARFLAANGSRDWLLALPVPAKPTLQVPAPLFALLRPDEAVLAGRAIRYLIRDHSPVRNLRFYPRHLVTEPVHLFAFTASSKKNAEQVLWRNGYHPLKEKEYVCPGQAPIFLHERTGGAESFLTDSDWLEEEEEEGRVIYTGARLFASAAAVTAWFERDVSIINAS